MRKSILLVNCDPCSEAVQTLHNACLRTLCAQPLDQGVQDALLLAMQEIIGHILDQARPSPTRLVVELMEEDGHWLLEVRDDGGPLANPLAPYFEKRSAILQSLSRLFTDASYIPGDAQTLNCFRVRHPASPKKPRVTLVDDDSSLRCLIKMYLQESYQVRDYPDAGSALAALDSEPSDLVISDIHMPGMDGLAFRRHLAEQPCTDILPFIFISSSDDDSLLYQAEDLGVDDYLIKPIRKRELLTTIRRILRRSRRIRDRLGDLLDPKVKLALRPALPPRLGRFRCALRVHCACTGGSDLLIYSGDKDGATLILADVLEQGPQAKFFAHAYAGYLGGLIRTLPTHIGPADVLLRLSADIQADPLLQSALVNCLVVRLRNDGHIQLAGAGQPLPMLVEINGTYSIEACGAPPGLLTVSEYTETTLWIQPKQRLLLYTDGLLPEDKRLTREQFKQVIRESSALPLAEAADHIMSSVDTLSHDDATLILLEDAHSLTPIA